VVHETLNGAEQNFLRISISCWFKFKSFKATTVWVCYMWRVACNNLIIECWKIVNGAGRLLSSIILY